MAGLLLQRYPPARESNLEARDLVEQALKINPDDADALVGDAFTYFRELYNGWTERDTDYDTKGLGQVDRAIALAPDKMSWDILLKASIWGFRTARMRQLRRPIRASSSIQILLCCTGRAVVAKIFLGRFEQAKSDARQAMRLSPRDPRKGLWHSYIGLAEFAQGHYDDAIDEYHKGLDAGYLSYVTYSGLAAALVVTGRRKKRRPPWLKPAGSIPN